MRTHIYIVYSVTVAEKRAGSAPSTHFTCFTGTKVHILTLRSAQAPPRRLVSASYRVL